MNALSISKEFCVHHSVDNDNLKDEVGLRMEAQNIKALARKF